MKMRSETYTNGVLVATAFMLTPGLGADRTTIPGDNATVATVNWAGTLGGPGATVSVSVNNVVTVLATTRDATTGLDALDFEITASVPGPIEIVVGADTLTLTAT